MVPIDRVPTVGSTEVHDKPASTTDTDRSTEAQAAQKSPADNEKTTDTTPRGTADSYDVEKAAIDIEERSDTRDQEFEVYWEEPADQDPENPMNWSFARKTTIIALVSFVSFLT